MKRSQDATDDTFELDIQAHAQGEDFQSYKETVPEAEASHRTLLTPGAAAKSLELVLRNKLPRFVRSSRDTLDENQRPPRLVRYWVPGLVLVVCSPARSWAFDMEPRSLRRVD